MKLSQLKIFRRIISSILFILILVPFLRLGDSFSESIVSSVLFYQFIPSLLKFIAEPAVWAAGFVFILFLTLLFGRVYCSSFCPLGYLQDLIIYLKQKKSVKRKYSYKASLDSLKSFTLAFIVTLFLFGLLFGVYLLDPYSIFGRIITQIIRPIYIGLNNLTVLTLENFDNYTFAPFHFKGLNIPSFLITISTLGLIVILAIKRGRLFCNSLCPVGIILGIVSKISLVKIAVDKNNCNGCGLCEKACKSECISSKDELIEFDRCVSCFNCFEVCPSNGLKYETRVIKENTVSIDQTKRGFITSVLSYAAISTIPSFAQKKIEVYTKNKIKIDRIGAISPPGSESIKHFTEQCTACHLCVSVCPSQVLQPAFLEYGIMGIMQPRLDNFKGYCDYECTMCGDVCPTGAIISTQKEKKKLIQLGIVKFVEDNCVVKTQGTDCGACSEHCPTKAVEMVPYEKKLKIPKTHEEICIGCGACEFACPTIPYKAIYVESNPIHKTAQKPKTEKIEIESFSEDDFPF